MDLWVIFFNDDGRKREFGRFLWIIELDELMWGKRWGIEKEMKKLKEMRYKIIGILLKIDEIGEDDEIEWFRNWDNMRWDWDGGGIS